VLLALVLAAGGPEAARAATSPSSVTMFSDGDYIGQGQARLYYTGSGAVTVSGTPSP
jgi:hypothetical protein